MAHSLSKTAWKNYTLRSVADGPSITMPVFIYGTAWKKERTADLVHQALTAGFRAVDTAGQPKHYQEHLVGDGIRRAIQAGTVNREDLYVSRCCFFSGLLLLVCSLLRMQLILHSWLMPQVKIQTKVSPIHAQDPANIPYDPHLPVTEQIHASIKRSLHNLRPFSEANSADQAYIDMLVLHSPLSTEQDTVDAWSALQSYVPDRIRGLGISNCTLPLLQALYTSPRVAVRPAVVQNPFHAGQHFDSPLRAFCREYQIIYQSFWTLTANKRLVLSEPVQLLADTAGVTPAAALYCLVLGLGNTAVLNGTTNEDRMSGDLGAPVKMALVAQEHSVIWEESLRDFKNLVGDV